MTLSKTPDEAGIERALVNSIHKHWALFLAEGIVLVILGAAAIVLPAIATITFAIFIGWLLLISGVVGLITTLWMHRRVPGFWWSLISAFIGIVAGVLLLLWPLTGVLSLTLVLSAFFI
ncbi:MAG: HdeD family acid-resistance protein, partial [Xanthobacteraceae bacterium]